jgi:hypothetical protein
MFQTSKDVLFLTLALCTAALTFFLCLGLYYASQAVRNLNHMLGSVKKRFDDLWNFVEHVKEKASKTAATTTVISKAVIDLVDYVKEKSKRTKSETK